MSVRNKFLDYPKDIIRRFVPKETIRTKDFGSFAVAPFQTIYWNNDIIRGIQFWDWGQQYWWDTIYNFVASVYCDEIDGAPDLNCGVVGSNGLPYYEQIRLFNLINENINSNPNLSNINLYDSDTVLTDVNDDELYRLYFSGNRTEDLTLCNKWDKTKTYRQILAVKDLNITVKDMGSAGKMPSTVEYVPIIEPVNTVTSEVDYAFYAQNIGSGDFTDTGYPYFFRKETTKSYEDDVPPGAYTNEKTVVKDGQEWLRTFLPENPWMRILNHYFKDTNTNNIVSHTTDKWWIFNNTEGSKTEFETELGAWVVGSGEDKDKIMYITNYFPFAFANAEIGVVHADLYRNEGSYNFDDLEIIPVMDNYYITKLANYSAPSLNIIGYYTMDADKEENLWGPRYEPRRNFMSMGILPGMSVKLLNTAEKYIGCTLPITKQLTQVYSDGLNFNKLQLITFSGTNCHIPLYTDPTWYKNYKVELNPWDTFLTEGTIEYFTTTFTDETQVITDTTNDAFRSDAALNNIGKMLGKVVFNTSKYPARGVVISFTPSQSISETWSSAPASGTACAVIKWLYDSSGYHVSDTSFNINNAKFEATNTYRIGYLPVFDAFIDDDNELTNKKELTKTAIVKAASLPSVFKEQYPVLSGDDYMGGLQVLYIETFDGNIANSTAITDLYDWGIRPGMIVYKDSFIESDDDVHSDFITNVVFESQDTPIEVESRRIRSPQHLIQALDGRLSWSNTHYGEYTAGTPSISGISYIDLREKYTVIEETGRPKDIPYIRPSDYPLSVGNQPYTYQTTYKHTNNVEYPSKDYIWEWIASPVDIRTRSKADSVLAPKAQEPTNQKFLLEYDVPEYMDLAAEDFGITTGSTAADILLAGIVEKPTNLRKSTPVAAKFAAWGSSARVVNPWAWITTSLEGEGKAYKSNGFRFSNLIDDNDQSADGIWGKKTGVTKVNNTIIERFGNLSGNTILSPDLSITYTDDFYTGISTGFSGFYNSFFNYNQCDNYDSYTSGVNFNCLENDIWPGEFAETYCGTSSGGEDWPDGYKRGPAFQHNYTWLFTPSKTKDSAAWVENAWETTWKLNQLKTVLRKRAKLYWDRIVPVWNGEFAACGSEGNDYEFRGRQTGWYKYRQAKYGGGYQDTVYVRRIADESFDINEFSPFLPNSGEWNGDLPLPRGALQTFFDGDDNNEFTSNTSTYLTSGICESIKTMTPLTVRCYEWDSATYKDYTRFVYNHDYLGTDSAGQTFKEYINSDILDVLGSSFNPSTTIWVGEDGADIGYGAGWVAHSSGELRYYPQKYTKDSAWTGGYVEYLHPDYLDWYTGSNPIYDPTDNYFTETTLEAEMEIIKRAIILGIPYLVRIVEPITGNFRENVAYVEPPNPNTIWLSRGYNSEGGIRHNIIARQPSQPQSCPEEYNVGVVIEPWSKNNELITFSSTVPQGWDDNDVLKYYPVRILDEITTSGDNLYLSPRTTNTDVGNFDYWWTYGEFASVSSPGRKYQITPSNYAGNGSSGNAFVVLDVHNIDPVRIRDFGPQSDIYDHGSDTSLKQVLLVKPYNEEFINGIAPTIDGLLGGDYYYFFNEAFCRPDTDKRRYEILKYYYSVDWKLSGEKDSVPVYGGYSSNQCARLHKSASDVGPTGSRINYRPSDGDKQRFKGDLSIPESHKFEFITPNNGTIVYNRNESGTGTEGWYYYSGDYPNGDWTYAGVEEQTTSDINFIVDYNIFSYPSPDYNKSIRSLNLFKGSHYNGDTEMAINVNNSPYVPIEIYNQSVGSVATANTVADYDVATLLIPPAEWKNSADNYVGDLLIAAYKQNGKFSIFSQTGVNTTGFNILTEMLKYYFGGTSTMFTDNGSARVYEGLHNPKYNLPLDMELINKSKYEIEFINDIVLLVFIGSACIEIVYGSKFDIDGEDRIYHRYLTEGWDTSWGDDVAKEYYTDLILGEEPSDYIQGDERRNAITAAIAPVVMENTGFDVGNISNDILEKLQFAYYAKPITGSTQFTFSTIYSFDDASGSKYNTDTYSDLYMTNVASLLNDQSNDNPILFNVFMEFPVVDDFDYIYFKMDFSNLLNLKEEDSPISNYINNRYTSGNYDEDSGGRILIKDVGYKLFDSIGLIDLRYYNQKSKKWMSTNIVEESESNGYYKKILSGTSTNALDPFGLVRAALADDGITSTTTIDKNYNPFFDYENSELIVETGDYGEIDYSNVIIKLAVKDGFKSLISSDYIKCDEDTPIIYGLTLVDNFFEINDKHIHSDIVQDKKLIWFAIPPIIQHTGGSETISNMSQFRIDDKVFGPSDMTIAHGAAVHGRYPVDIFRCLRSLWIE